MLMHAMLLPAVLVALTLNPAASSADGPACEKPNPATGRCVIEIPAPSPGLRATPVGNSASGGAAPECTRYPAIAVPCSDPRLGAWSNPLGVYCKVAGPQPSTTADVWRGHQGKGSIYDCMDPFGSGNFRSGQLWLPASPRVVISPEEAAQTVVRRMNLRAADIGIVPSNRPGSMGAVGAPVYMWTTPGPTTFGPQVLSASEGGVTITATARVEKIVWDMGDGATVTCTTPGTVYEDQYGFKDSPDCGHRYTHTSAGKPNDAYPISATSFWVVDWTGPGGSSGRIPLELVSRASIVVGELQALVTS